MTKFKFTPEVDLFASRLNKQFTKYCSCRPDPEAMYIDAFSVSWKNLKFYCFPPFSCVLQAVQKIKQEKATGILVIPNWPTQPWYPLIAPLLVEPLLIHHPSKSLLQLPAAPEEQHSSAKKLELKVSCYAMCQGTTCTIRCSVNLNRYNYDLLEKGNEVPKPDIS